MQKISILLVLLFASFSNFSQSNVNSSQGGEFKKFSYPQNVKKDRYNVAVLSPLYLDSVEWEKNLSRIPSFMTPGIDFYQGARIAADTLNKAGFQINLFIYDSKSNYLDVNNLITSDKLDSMDLIIGNASVSDLKLLGDFAERKKINFVSAVSPSDAGQETNPYFTILQPRLVSHVEKLHKHINSRYPEDNVVFINRKVQSEQNALQYFKNDIMNSLPGRFSELELNGDEINMKALIQNIDSNYNTTIVLGTLDPEVTYKNLKVLAPFARRFHLKVYCMPTAEAIRALNKTEEFPFMPIYFTTSYLIDKITPASMYINKEYKRYMGSAPTDIVYKGFESLYFFANLLNRYGVPFNEKLGDNSFTFITPYKIVPVKEKGVLQFYENKFLYLIKYQDGVMSYE